MLRDGGLETSLETAFPLQRRPDRWQLTEQRIQFGG
jgi:hypothetical protein